MKYFAVVVVALAGGVTLGPPRALAQQDAPGSDRGPTTTVLQTTVSSEDDAGTAGAVERTIRARLDALGVVDTAGTPGLGLEDLQLAVGCVGETPECLQAVAEQLEVDALLLSSLDRADDTLVLTLTFFRSEDRSTTEVVRQASGEQAENELLDSIDGALREMFDLPPAPEAEEPTTTGDDDTAAAGAAAREGDGSAGGDASVQAEADGGLSPVPFIVAGAGLAALAVGVGFGVKSQNTEDEYANIEPATAAEADRALSKLDDAEREARIANAMFGVGGALVAGGAVLFFVLDRPGEAPERQVRVTPSVSPHAGGVVLSGSFGGSR